MTRITFEGFYGSKIVVESHGAAKDLFRIDDGEGGFSRYHLSEAPELIDAIRKVAGLDKETPSPEAVKEAIDYYDFSESIEALRADVRAHNERSDRLRDDIEAIQSSVKLIHGSLFTHDNLINSLKDRVAALEQESLQQQARRDSLVELREDALESVNDYLQSLEGRTPRRIHE